MLTIARNKFFNYYLPGILSVALIAAAGFFWIGVKSVRAGFTFSRSVTLQASKVPSTQPNFTVLVCANGASPCNTAVAGLNQTGGGAHVQSPSGFDIVFSTTSDCNSLMNWEMENYVASTGEMEAWVLVTSLSSSANTVIFMCYGNSAISSFQGGATGSAWDANYKGVWHFPNGTSLTALDSTGLNNATIQGSSTPIAGQVDGAQGFSGVAGNYDSLASTTSLNISGDITLSAWAKTSLPGQQTIIGGYNSGGSFNGYGLGINSSGAGGFPGVLQFWSGTTGVWKNASSNTYANGSWHFVVASVASTTISFYKDGLSDGSVAGNGANSYAGVRAIGASSGAALIFNGSLDEVRISNTARTASWIATEFNNQNSPSTFESFGSEGPGVTKSGNFVLMGGKYRQAGGKVIIK